MNSSSVQAVNLGSVVRIHLIMNGTYCDITHLLSSAERRRHVVASEWNLCSQHERKFVRPEEKGHDENNCEVTRRWELG